MYNLKILARIVSKGLNFVKMKYHGGFIMPGKVFGLLATISFITAVFTGNMDVLSGAISSSALRATELVISLAGSMCLWSGLSRVLDECGFSDLLQRITSPLLSVIYPDAFSKNCGIKECAANISANFLGLGNAALPTGIAAMKKLSSNSERPDGKANDDAVMFAVLATTPIQLIPVTLFTLRETAGSVAPYEILIPIWICETATTFFAVLICKLMSRIFR